MRATIDKHNEPLVARVMETLGTDNPSVAVNYLLNHYAMGGNSQSPPAPPKTQAADDYGLTFEDWGD
jgi:hypothetical protein